MEYDIYGFYLGNDLVSWQLICSQPGSGVEDQDDCASVHRDCQDWKCKYMTIEKNICLLSIYFEKIYFIHKMYAANTIIIEKLGFLSF